MMRVARALSPPSMVHNDVHHLNETKQRIIQSRCASHDMSH
jgi:hypothetical protein